MTSRSGRHRTLHLGAAALLLVAAGCVPAAVPPGGLPGDDTLVPAGYGTLRQDEVTLSLQVGDLQVKVTPLAEWVIRLTAPDTYHRLSALAATTRAALPADAPGEATLFLVSFFSRTAGTAFQPEDLELVNRGRRSRPVAVHPVTSGFDARRLDAESTEMAVYAFPPDVDLEQDLTVEYGTVRSTGWSSVLPRLEAERARVRARAGALGG